MFNEGIEQEITEILFEGKTSVCVLEKKDDVAEELIRSNNKGWIPFRNPYPEEGYDDSIEIRAEKVVALSSGYTYINER